MSINKQQGFTIIEILIVIAIIGILAAIAVPSYQTYTQKSYFTEMVQASGPFKVGVETCYQSQGALTTCSNGANGVPPNITATTGNVAGVTTLAGVITVTPVAAHGITGTETYQLTPTVSNGVLTWASTGGCVAAGVC